jgi:hypothetical protein
MLITTPAYHQPEACHPTRMAQLIRKKMQFAINPTSPLPENNPKKRKIRIPINPANKVNSNSRLCFFILSSFYYLKLTE